MFTKGFSSFCQSQHCIRDVSCEIVHLVMCVCVCVCACVCVCVCDYLVCQRAEGLMGQSPWLSLSNNPG